MTGSGMSGNHGKSNDITERLLTPVRSFAQAQIRFGNRDRNALIARNRCIRVKRNPFGNHAVFHPYRISFGFHTVIQDSAILIRKHIGNPSRDFYYDIIIFDGSVCRVVDFTQIEIQSLSALLHGVVVGISDSNAHIAHNNLMAHISQTRRQTVMEFDRRNPSFHKSHPDSVSQGFSDRKFGFAPFKRFVNGRISSRSKRFAGDFLIIVQIRVVIVICGRRTAAIASAVRDAGIRNPDDIVQSLSRGHAVRQNTVESQNQAGSGSNFQTRKRYGIFGIYRIRKNHLCVRDRSFGSVEIDISSGGRDLNPGYLFHSFGKNIFPQYLTG